MMLCLPQKRLGKVGRKINALCINTIYPVHFCCVPIYVISKRGNNTQNIISSDVASFCLSRKPNKSLIFIASMIFQILHPFNKNLLRLFLTVCLYSLQHKNIALIIFIKILHN